MNNEQSVVMFQMLFMMRNQDEKYHKNIIKI